MNLLDTPNPFVPPGPPPLPRLAVAARLHLSTLTWEQAEAALNPLRLLPGYAAYAIAIVLKPLLTGELPKLLQTITYSDFMLYPDVLRLNIADQDSRPIYDYLTWKGFLKGTFDPPPPPMAVPLYELSNFRQAAEQWRSRVIKTRRKVRKELESIARAAAVRNPAAAATLPALADRIMLKVTYHPIPPLSAELTAAALHRYRELEWKYQERLRQRLRDRVY